MTKPELIEIINRLENNFVTSCLSIGIINNPEIQKYYLQWLEPGSRPEFYSKSTNSFYGAYETHNVFKDFFSNPIGNIDYMKIPAMSMISLMYDTLKENGFLNNTPEFEFFRHLRNAVSHGNKFIFYDGEPRRPASFQGLVIEKKLNGKENVIREFVDFGDILSLISFIKNSL